MDKFMNKYSEEILDDNTGEYYDKPVACGGFPTKHAIKRAKERNVSKRDINFVSRISEVTINKCYKKLEDIQNEFLPPKIKEKYIK